MSKPVSKENPNAFKLMINDRTVKKYFSDGIVSQKEVQKITQKLNQLELRARVQLIAHELATALPKNFPSALTELLKITRRQNLKSFELWPATEFIQIYGLDHIDLSLTAMHELTQKFTAEFCIRPFINRYGDKIYDLIHQWKNDPNEHVRRWLTEGTRPRLPWGEKLHLAVKNPTRGLEILDHLRFDNSLYVRKSVGNHLNDIAKDHPDLVIKTLSQWKKDVPDGQLKEFNFICQRALRTLIKNGHPKALKFIGLNLDKKNIHCTAVRINETKFKIGDTLQFNFSIQNKTQKKMKYVVDYVIYYQKANKSLSPKVYKLKNGTLSAGEKIDILKLHGLKPITTRKYHFGKHALSVKVNGNEQKSQEFYLLKKT